MVIYGFIALFVELKLWTMISVTSVIGKIQVLLNTDGGPNKMTLAEAKEAYAKGLPIR